MATTIFVNFFRVARLNSSLQQHQRAMSQAARFRPVVFSGPTGSGKSTLIKRLMDEYKECFAFSVSHTTRNAREGEQNGREYYFVPRTEFEGMITADKFVEYAQFSGNLYGTSKKAIDDVIKSGRICILDLEVNGVKSMKNTSYNPRYIFVKTPSLKVLEERLRGRGTENEETFRRRMATAEESLAYAEEEGAYDHIVVNDDLNVAYEKLRGVLSEDMAALQKLL